MNGKLTDAGGQRQKVFGNAFGEKLKKNGRIIKNGETNLLKHMLVVFDYLD